MPRSAILWAWILKLVLMNSGPQRILQRKKILRILWDQLPSDYEAGSTPRRGPYWPSHWLESSAPRGFSAGLVFSGISFPPTCFLTETHCLTQVWGSPAGLSWDRVFHSDHLCLPNLPSPLNCKGGSLSLQKLLELQANSILCTCAQCYLRAARHHCHIRFSLSTTARCPWKSLPTLHPLPFFCTVSHTPETQVGHVVWRVSHTSLCTHSQVGVAAQTLCPHSDVQRKTSGVLREPQKGSGCHPGGPPVEITPGHPTQLCSESSGLRYS